MLNLDDNSSAFQVRAYKPGTIQVNEQMFTHSIIISPNKLIEHWEPQHISQLKAEHLACLLDFEPKPTILLIGTGATMQFPPIETYGELINHHIGVEIMNTSAACRTFNALSAENRNVVAALIID